MNITHRLRWAAPGLTLLALLLCGCGVSDYEMKMEQSQRRVAYLDEQNRYLADGSLTLPTTRPTKEQEQSFPSPTFFDVFFRPPRGITVGRPTGEPVGDFFSTYPATPLVQDAIFDHLCVAGLKSKDPEKKNEFRSSLLTALNISAEAEPKTKMLGQPLGRSLQFKWYHEKTETDERDLYLYEDPEFLVAIAFFPKPATPGTAPVPADKVIDFSLTSLYVGPPAIPVVNKAMAQSAAKAEAK